MQTNPMRLLVLDMLDATNDRDRILAHLCARRPWIHVNFGTDHDDRAAGVTVIRAGASGFFIEPLEKEKFVAAVQYRLSRPRD